MIALFAITTVGPQTIPMPLGSTVLTTYAGSLVVEAATDADMVPRSVWCAPIGGDVPAGGVFVGVVKVGADVCVVYDLGEAGA